MQAPTQNVVTQGKHGTYNAVDYSASPDPNIYAPEDGTILSYANNGDCGNNLQMNGATGRHGFCHLESTNVKVGQSVKRGQVIGVMGYTGKTIPAGEGGRHLHWVIYRNNIYVYPPSLVNESFIKGEEDMIKDVDNEYGRWRKLGQQIRGRDLTRNEFRKSAVGLTWLRAMEILSDNAEADKATAAQAWALANRTKIEKQLKDQQAQIESLKAQVGDNSKWETFKALVRELVGK